MRSFEAASAGSAAAGDLQLDLGQLRALFAVVTEGTFDAAARALHLTPSALSQRIKALETGLGQVLVVRSKPVAPTEAGRLVLRLACQVDLLTADTAAALDAHKSQQQATGSDTAAPAPPPVVLAVAVNADSLATWVLPALAPLTDRYCFDLRRADQERTAELLRTGTVMAAITADARPVTGCTSTPLGVMTYRPVACAAFAARWFPTGPTPAALGRAPVVVFDRDDDLQHDYLRRRSSGLTRVATGELHSRADPPTHHVPASADFLQAIQLGMGWGMLPDQQSRPHLDSGDLVEIDEPGRIDVPLHWQRWKLRSASLDELTNAVVHAARTNLHQ